MTSMLWMIGFAGWAVAGNLPIAAMYAVISIINLKRND